MNRLGAMIAIFLVASLAAAYVALAPNAPLVEQGVVHGILEAFDTVAAHLIGLQERGTVVLGLIGLGVVLGLLAAYTIDEDRCASASRLAVPLLRRRSRRIAPQEDPTPGPVWRPQSLNPEDRIAGLRRRAEALVEEDNAASIPPEDDGQPSPVVLVRTAREREHDWFDDTSWFGGLPRLGAQPWPRAPSGVPLPFAAQIDLEQLALACPDSPLPATGSLAFFLGTGAVIPVEGAIGDFTDPPADLPPAYDEGGVAFPAQPSRLSRHFFPFWPVTALPLSVPRDLSDRAGPDREAAILRALGTRLPALVASRPRMFRSADAQGLWWHSVSYLADRLHATLHDAQAPLAARRAAIEFQRDVAHDDAAPATPDHRQAALEELARLEEELVHSEERLAALPAMVEALDGFAANRMPWQRLTTEEQYLVSEILGEVNAHYLDFVRGHLPATVGDLATVSLRAMISGPAEALDEVPDEVLDRINREHRLADRAQHRLFGPALPVPRVDEVPTGKDEQPLLLLQLGADDLIEWRWEEGKVFRFRIATADALAGDWTAARLSYEDV